MYPYRVARGGVNDVIGNGGDVATGAQLSALTVGISAMSCFVIRSVVTWLGLIPAWEVTYQYESGSAFGLSSCVVESRGICIKYGTFLLENGASLDKMY